MKDDETVHSAVTPYAATHDEKALTEMEFYENADDDAEDIDEELNFAEDEKVFLGMYIFMLAVQ